MVKPKKNMTRDVRHWYAWFEAPQAGHILRILLFLSLSYLYMSPVIIGHRLIQEDKLQTVCNRSEFEQHFDRTGEIGRWSNRLYSGMPADLVFARYPANLPQRISGFLSSVFPTEIVQMFLLFVCFYISFVLIGYSGWISFFGAVSFCLATENLILIEVGHASKVRAIAFSVPFLTGVYLLFKKPGKKAALMVLFGGSFLVAMMHHQITFYALILACIIGLFGFRQRMQRYGLPSALKVLTFLLLLGVVSALPSISLLWSTYDYMKSSVRGKQILEEEPLRPSDGLSWEYASSYSLGIVETLGCVVPGLMGGSSKTELDENSNAFRAITANQIIGIPNNGKRYLIPMYWGNQPYRAGPFYFGIVVLFLFVFGCLSRKGRFRQLILCSIGISLVIAWGKNFSLVNESLFIYFPFFNKFRSPTMIMSLASILIVWMAMEGLQQIIKGKTESNFRALAWVGGSLFAISILIAILSPVTADFSANAGRKQIGSGADNRFEQRLIDLGNAPSASASLMKEIRTDRKELLVMDAIRSSTFVILLLILLFIYYRKLIRVELLLPIFIFLSLFDLWTIDKRYFNKADFSLGMKYRNPVNLTPCDSIILTNSGPGDRMADISISTFQNSIPAYYHQTIGGNHGAKLRRYQDVIDGYLLPELAQIRAGANRISTPGINMLNTRFIKKGPLANEYLENVTASGQLWIADSVVWVASNQAEFDAISSFSSPTRTFLHDQFRDYLEGWRPQPTDSSDKISIEEYLPGRLRYNCQLNNEQLIVFSEICHRPNEYWKSYIDGVEVQHIRANYLLRALRVPAGKHEILFEYQPKPYYVGEALSWFGSTIWIFCLVFGFFRPNIPGIDKMSTG